MKILVLANDGVGLYNFRRELLETLIRQGHSVSVALPMNACIPKLQKMGCQYLEAAVDRRGTNPVKDLSLLINYIKIMRKTRPDLVLTYTVKPNIYGGLVCRWMKTHYITNITGLGTALVNDGLIKKLVIPLYRMSLKSSACVFFQNRPNRDLFINKHIVQEMNTRVLPGSGVNLDQHQFEEYPEERQQTIFLYIGRIMKEKGIDELLEASARVKEKTADVQFDLIGECEEDYHARLLEATKAGIITYHGFSDNVHAFIRQSHAIVLPSYHEGTSNVLLESAATGRPVLASKVPGCMETFDEGISGLGFEVKDAKSLENAILQFIALPYEKKKMMGIAGRQKMKSEYDRNRVINSYLAEIDRIAGGGL